jgi:hypothetical protein
VSRDEVGVVAACVGEASVIPLLIGHKMGLIRRGVLLIFKKRNLRYGEIIINKFQLT